MTKTESAKIRGPEQRPSLSRALNWVIVTTLGLALAAPLDKSYSLSNGGTYVGYVIVGFGQWMLLRSISQIPWSWALMTCIGLLLGNIVSLTLAPVFCSLACRFLAEQVVFFISLGFGGLIIGFLQWLVMRQNFANSKSWIFLSAIAYPLGVGGLSLLSSIDFAGHLFGPVLGQIWSFAPGVIWGSLEAVTLEGHLQRRTLISVKANAEIPVQ